MHDDMVRETSVMTDFSLRGGQVGLVSHLYVFGLAWLTGYQRDIVCEDGYWSDREYGSEEKKSYLIPVVQNEPWEYSGFGHLMAQRSTRCRIVCGQPRDDIVVVDIDDDGGGGGGDDDDDEIDVPNLHHKT
ncbi:hypothetical protein RJT34_30938 [Clitoria ternatea]|uniref:Uncharacterized protein n=1 Tax=Clitoria ternatea TaxID=43366 RepID=A0AAN9I4I8_CLITE